MQRVVLISAQRERQDSEKAADRGAGRKRAAGRLKSDLTQATPHPVLQVCRSTVRYCKVPYSTIQYRPVQ